MGVSEFTLTEVLPDKLIGSLPTLEEIEADMKQLEKSCDGSSIQPLIEKPFRAVAVELMKRVVKQQAAEASSPKNLAKL